MQASIRTTNRIVLQIGTNLGALDGCTVEDVTAPVATQIQALLPQVAGDGGVVLSADHTNVTLQGPSAAYTAAKTQAATDAATLKTAVQNALAGIPGTAWTALTAAQKQAVIVALLYKVGALDKTLTVQPLNTWL